MKYCCTCSTGVLSELKNLTTAHLHYYMLDARQCCHSCLPHWHWHWHWLAGTLRFEDGAVQEHKQRDVRKEQKLSQRMFAPRCDIFPTEDTRTAPGGCHHERRAPGLVRNVNRCIMGQEQLDTVDVIRERSCV